MIIIVLYVSKFDEEISLTLDMSPYFENDLYLGSFLVALHHLFCIS